MSSYMSSEIKHSSLFRYAIPEGFDPNGIHCPDEKMTKKEIDESIELAKADFLRGKAALKIEFSEDFIRKQQIAAAKLSKGISQLTLSLISSYKGTGRALDIGCGIGLSCLALLSKGWSVYALDKHKEVLEIFETYLSEIEPKGKCTIVNKDITKVRLKPCDLDLVLTNDVLSYLPPDSLIPTIKKIYATLMPGGIFMGSFLVNRKLETDKDIIAMAQMRVLNSYSYTNPAIVANILRLIGFHMEICSLSPLMHSLHPACIVRFVARKLPEDYEERKVLG